MGEIASLILIVTFTPTNSLISMVTVVMMSQPALSWPK